MLSLYAFAYCMPPLLVLMKSRTAGRHGIGAAKEVEVVPTVDVIVAVIVVDVSANSSRVVEVNGTDEVDIVVDETSDQLDVRRLDSTSDVIVSYPEQLKNSELY